MQSFTTDKDFSCSMKFLHGSLKTVSTAINIDGALSFDTMYSNKKKTTSNRLTPCLLGNISCFLSSANIFQNKFFEKNILGIPSGCQTDWVHSRPTFCRA